MRKHQGPSDRQLKAIAIKAANPTMSKKDAALQAGYSESTAHNATKAIFSKPIVVTWLENYKYTIEKTGITPDRMARKLDELLDASNPIITMAGPLIDKATGEVMTRPDRKIQLATVKVLHDVYGVGDSGISSKDTGVKRRITLEEFEDKEGIASNMDN